MFCDTELLTNVLWADLLFPQRCPIWVRVKAEARSRRYALYLLCDTDLAFAADPQRCFPDPVDRAYCRQLWRQTLTEHHLSFVEVRGTGDARVQQAIDAVNRYVPDPSGGSANDQPG